MRFLSCLVRIGMQIVAMELLKKKKKIDSLFFDTLINIARLVSANCRNDSGLIAATAAHCLLERNLEPFRDQASQFFVFIGQVNWAIKAIQPTRRGQILIIQDSRLFRPDLDSGDDLRPGQPLLLTACRSARMKSSKFRAVGV